jgi:hypothetical protein
MSALGHKQPPSSLTSGRLVSATSGHSNHWNARVMVRTRFGPSAYGQYLRCRVCCDDSLEGFYLEILSAHSSLVHQTAFCLCEDGYAAFIAGTTFRRQLTVLNIQDVPTPPRSPWQNAYAERVIGSIRRECLNHLIVLGQRHLRRFLRSYVDYYNETRTHLSLDKVCTVHQGDSLAQ